MKTAWLVFAICILLIFSMGYANTESQKQTSLTDIGTYEVTFKTIPITPEKEKQTKIVMQILTIPEKEKQIHVDYKIEISNYDGLIHSTPTKHHHSGTATTSFSFPADDTYSIKIIIDGIVFSPIPVETATFFLQIGTSSDVLDTEIPQWIKQVADFWIQGQINDKGFVQVIEYLIQNDIIIVTFEQTMNDDSKLEIPSWIKTNAQFWIDEKITDGEFAIGIQWLINNGMIKIT